MAQKRVERSDIWAPDALTTITKEAKNLETQLTKVLGVNEKILKSTQVKGGKGIKQYQETIQATKASTSALNTVTKERLRLESRLKIANSTKIDQNTRLKVQVIEQNKVNKQLAREQLGLVGSYEKLAKELAAVTRQFKNAASVYGVNSKEAKKLKVQMDRLRGSVTKVDQAAGQFGRNVGNYTSAMGKLGGAFRNVAQAAGLTLGIFGAVQVVRNAINVVKDYEKANATLSGVLGLQLEQMNALIEDSQRLGAVTEYTASQVVSLQEAYARLGFTQSEILNTTEATLRGATALQSELGATAELVGSTMRQFGLDSSEAGEVIDILGKSTQISALNFERLSVALPILGKTSQLAGNSLKQTAAVLGVLTSNGIDASTSATAYRNILLDLSDKGLTFEEAMNKINTATDKNAVAFELFGKRGATVSATLATNSEALDDLNKKMIDVNGTTKEMAEKQLNTLDGSLKLLNSAWQGFILKMNDASGAGNSLTKGLRFLAENLEQILKSIRNAVIVFGAYKVLTLAVTAAIQVQRIATVAATSAQRGLNVAMKANPIGLVITGLTLLISLIPVFASEAKDARKDLKDFNDELERTKEIQKKVNGLNARIDSIGGLSPQGLRELRYELESEVAILTSKLDETVLDEGRRQKEIQNLQAATARIRNDIRKSEEAGLDTLAETQRNALAQNLRDIESAKTRSIEQDQETLDRRKKLVSAMARIDARLSQVGGAQSISFDAEFRVGSSSGDIDFDKLQKDAKKRAEAEKEALFGRYQTMSDTTKKLIKDADDGLKKLEADRLAAQEKLRQDVVRTTELITQAMDQRDEREKRSLDNQLEYRKENIARQERLAEQGLGNTLAFEQAKAAKLEAERERIAKKQEKRQKTLAYLTAFTEYLKENPNTAAGKALAQVAIAETVSGLFYEGTESVGDDNATKWRNTGRDDYLIGVHKGERVIKTSDNKRIGNMSNEDLVAMAEAHQKGEYQVNALNDTNIVNELRSVRKAVSSSGQVIDVDKLGQMIDKRIEDGIKKTIVHKRKPRRI